VAIARAKPALPPPIRCHRRRAEIGAHKRLLSGLSLAWSRRFHLPAHREVTIHLRLRPRILVSTMYEPTTFTRNQIEVVGVNRDSPKRGVSYLVFRCCKQVISSRMKQPDAGTRPKARPGRTIASFGSTWQVGGKAYCAPTMKTTRISKRCAPSAHSERLRSFARSSRSLPVFQLGEDSWWRAASAGPGRGLLCWPREAGLVLGKGLLGANAAKSSTRAFASSPTARLAGSARHLWSHRRGAATGLQY
jgi:hypothetical protein